MRPNIIKQKVLALMLTIAALAVGQSAWAESLSYTDSNGIRWEYKFS